MGKFQPYDSYKACDVPWLGDVPSEWGATRLKFECRVNMGQSPSSDDCNAEGFGLPFLQGNAEFTRATPNAKQYCDEAKKIAKKGDLLLSVRAPVGALNRADQPYGIGRGLCAITPTSNVAEEFIWWLLPVVRTELESISTGSTFESVAAEQVENVRFYAPSLIEQRQIAAFLDHETARIDTLIAKQKRLIELLKEKRQAVISHAVTKGLNPDAPMKDSGVEWLGEVPAHWNVTQLQHVVDPKRKIMYGIVLPGPNVDKGVPIVKGGDVKPGRLTLPLLCKTTREIEANYARSRLKTGDLVYSIRGTIGDVEIVPPEIEGANLTQDAARIAPMLGIQNVWLKYVLESDQVFRQLEIGSLGAAVKGINIRDLKNALIPLPPTEERTAIAEHLDCVLGKLDLLESRAAQQVALLQEHRTALISAAVTGKIDVRGWQRPNQEPQGTAIASSA